MLDRRQWLKTLLASGSLLSSGCRQRPQRYGGSIIGPSAERGHLLRDRGDALRSRPATERQRAQVVIVGGGVAGLSAAWRLARAGFDDFVLLELEDQAGGTACSGENRITPYPWGAHYLPVPTRDLTALGELLRELGVINGYDAAGRAICAEQYLCRSPQERIYYKGRWFEGLYLRAGASAADLEQFDRFHHEIGRWVTAKDSAGRRAFALPYRHATAAASAAGALDQLSMAQHLDRLGLDSPRLRWYVDYACRDDYGLRSAATSAWAGIHYFAARLLHPDDAPAEVLTWPEGNGWLVKRLLERLGKRVRTGCLAVDVRQLPPSGSSDNVEVLYLDGSQAPLDRAPLCSLSARQVIFALPTFLRHRLISSLRAAPPAWAPRFTYAPWLVANLTVRRAHAAPVGSGAGDHSEGSGAPPAWDNVLVESPSLGYVVATHQREAAPPTDGQPRTVWTYYLPLCDDTPARERTRLQQTSWASWCDLILADLKRAEPQLAAQVEQIDLYRWGHGMIRPIPGLVTSGALEAAAAPLGDIHFAHTDLSGMALFEQAHQAGVSAAEAVLDAAGHPTERWG